MTKLITINEWDSSVTNLEVTSSLGDHKILWKSPDSRGHYSRILSLHNMDIFCFFFHISANVMKSKSYR